MGRFVSRQLLWCLAFAVMFVAADQAQGDLRIKLDPPDQREFILDKAQILDENTETELRATCDQLLNDKAIPIVIVTIESMADHGGGGLRIETFARLLFDQWGIGHAALTLEDGGKSFSWNHGILLLVSKGDRKARIELGADWGREKDALCKQIMDQQIIPQFKQGDFGGGIVAGVAGLDAMAREKELPSPPEPWWHVALVIAFTGLVTFTVVSLIRRGSGGWAWVFWAALFAIGGYMLYQMLNSSGSGGGGGSFGGGSCGGGFSGGGGASGSW